MAKCESIFTSEEGNGKYLDLNNHFIAFKNIKIFQKYKDEINLPNDYLSWL